MAGRQEAGLVFYGRCAWDSVIVKKYCHAESPDLSGKTLTSSCCGKPKPEMSPLRKQGSMAWKLDSCFRRNDKCCFRNRY